MSNSSAAEREVAVRAAVETATVARASSTDAPRRGSSGRRPSRERESSVSSGSSARGSSAERGSAGRSSNPKKLSMWKQVQHGYGELVNAIIRPPRAEYSLSDLGPVNFRVAERSFLRRELQIKNLQNLTLECSWWEPVEAERIQQELPCAIYMHGNSSCRLEALELLPLVLGMGITLFSFDFSGCGLSGGDYITLGFREKDDLQEVVKHLRSTGKVSSIALWGRSMGAATALLHAHRDQSIAAMVLDSPFSSLERLAREIIDKAQIKHKPDFLVKAFLKMMRSTILKRSGLDILKLKPIKDVHTCFIPALFVAGRNDQFIPPKHASDLCNAYAGDKNIILVEGSHNTRRPAYFMDSVSIFFYSRLCVPVGLTEERLGLRPKPPDAADCKPSRGSLGAGLGTAAVCKDEHTTSDAERASQGAAAAASTTVAESDGLTGAAGRLVACATSQTQSTAPECRSAADALRAQ